ncbi:hypothetical protein C8Q74DRAFT_524250 [Fomes fomentarius]|nr:hypothetical protein C8Q74DRAFT_524250 [Fomes fomentarius]
MLVQPFPLLRQLSFQQCVTSAPTMNLDSRHPHRSLRCARIALAPTAPREACGAHTSVQLNISMDSLEHVLTSRTYQPGLLRIHCSLTMIMGSRRCPRTMYHRYSLSIPANEPIAEITVLASTASRRGREPVLGNSRLSCCLTSTSKTRFFAVSFPCIHIHWLSPGRRPSQSNSNFVLHRSTDVEITAFRDIMPSREVLRWKSKCTQGGAIPRLFASAGQATNSLAPVTTA